MGIKLHLRNRIINLRVWEVRMKSKLTYSQNSNSITMKPT